MVGQFKKVFAQINQDASFSHTRENSKMFKMRVPKWPFVFLRNWDKKFRNLWNTSAWFSLFHFKVTLKIEIWVSTVSTFHFSFFTDIENTK